MPGTCPEVVASDQPRRDCWSILMATVVSAWIAHLLAWAASVWLLLGPAYQGVALTTEGTTRVSATFIEVNGLHVIWVPIVPVLLSGIALMAILRTDPGQHGRGLLLWTISGVFLGFCALGLFSFGFLYLPVALVLIIAAVADLRRPRGARPTSRSG